MRDQRVGDVAEAGPVPPGDVDLTIVEEGMVSDALALTAGEPASVAPGLRDTGFADQLTIAPVERDPAWLRALTIWHRADRHIGPIAIDLISGYFAVRVATGSTSVAARASLSFLAVGLLFGVWKRRTSLEAQGVTWFMRHLVPTVLAVGLVARVAIHGVTDRRAATAMIALVVAIAGIRVLLWQAIAAGRRHGLGLAPTLIIGADHRTAQISRRMDVFPEAGLRFEASFEPKPYDGTTPQTGHALVDYLLDQYQVKHILCVADDANDVILKDFVRFGEGRVDLSVLLPLARMSAPHATAHLGDLALIPVQLKSSWGAYQAKRVFDVCASAVLLTLASPILALAAIAIRLDSEGPVIFRQRRVGLGGRPFTIYKFRSMVAGAEFMQADYLNRNVHTSLLFKVDSDPRVTSVGSVLRRFSIDELPQLFNVLKGDMSLVGPRPLAVDPDEFDTGAQIRHRVLPGITGLWQVHGANALPYGDMVELDLSYVATNTFGSDMMLLLKTIPALLVRRAPY